MNSVKDWNVESSKKPARFKSSEDFLNELKENISITGDRGHSQTNSNGISITHNDGYAQSALFGISIAGVCGIAVAGYEGIAIAADYGQADAAMKGVAVVRQHGIATAKSQGLAIADIHGEAHVAENGIAIGQRMTIVSGGPGSIIMSEYVDTRRRMLIGYVGEDGIKPYTKYEVQPCIWYPNMPKPQFVEVK